MIKFKKQNKNHIRIFWKMILKESQQLNLEWKLSGYKGYVSKPENNIKETNGEFNSKLWGTLQRNKSKQSVKTISAITSTRIYFNSCIKDFRIQFIESLIVKEGLLKV